jgi:hypothetical protein
VIARRSRLYGGDGSAPRRIAWLALLTFIVAGVAVLVSLVAEQRDQNSLLLPQYATMAWRVKTAETLSLIGWVLTLVAAVWNGVLGVALRRRTAIQELKRRTDRVRDYRTPPSSPRA